MNLHVELGLNEIRAGRPRDCFRDSVTLAIVRAARNAGIRCPAGVDPDRFILVRIGRPPAGSHPDQAPDPAIQVAGGYCQIGGHHRLPLPDYVIAFIDRFDRGESVEPIQFDLSLPDGSGRVRKRSPNDGKRGVKAGTLTCNRILDRRNRRKNLVCLRCGNPAPRSMHPSAAYCSVSCRKITERERKALRRAPRPITTGMSGAISEMAVCSDLLRRGVDVFRAVSPSASCDLIALHDGKLFRIEVTKGYHRANGTLAWIQHEETKYDVIAVVINFESVEYIPNIFPERHG